MQPGQRQEHDKAVHKTLGISGNATMPSTATTQSYEVDLFVQASLRALVRAEVEGRVPLRFTGEGPAVWSTFRNELTAADLAALAIQDAGAGMPVPFAPEHWWPDWPEWGLLHLPPAEVAGWIEKAPTFAEQPRDAYLRAQAGVLGVDLPSDEALAGLPLPARHERWLELPGTGGWVAYALCSRPGAELYFWDNFTIVCESPLEMLFAGLIAWGLDAPPNTELPIRLDDTDLTATLKSGASHHEIVGLSSRHAHRDLRLLHKEGRQPLWL